MKIDVVSKEDAVLGRRGKPKGALHSAIIKFANTAVPGDVMKVELDTLSEAKEKAAAAYNIIHRYGYGLCVNRRDTTVYIFIEEA